MRTSQPYVPQNVAILGGGTAGYLAALTLRALHPNLELTLIYSSKVPISGVGEATTSEIVPFLHTVLGFDPGEFYREVAPTWKLGIKFIWGPTQNPFFNYPFDRGPLLEAYLYEGHARNGSLVSALMTEDGSPFLSSNGSSISLLPDLPFAYHLDNRKFVQFLRRKATERNIRHLDHKIIDACLCPDGETIDHVITADGQTLKYDFYVDCTGFRSLLLEQKLGSSFRSYGSSLYTDSAVVASAGHAGLIKPYTTAETMDHGWCWNIPQVDEDHLGYVFSSAFCSEEEAIAEMQQKHPGMHDPWVVKFRSGRHAHFIKGNVAAIGNSYGFVEPLESTAIFVICRQCLLLGLNLTAASNGSPVQDWLSATVGNMWDYLRWFLAIHYRFNSRVETPFWRECQAGVDVSGAEPILALYRDRAPLSYGGNCGDPCRGHSFDGHSFDGHSFGGHSFDGHAFDGYNFAPCRNPGNGHNFDAFGYDVLLFGQGVPAQRIPPRQSRDEYFDYSKKIKSIAAGAMRQAPALNVLLRDKPELLASQSWIPRLAETMLRVCREGVPGRATSCETGGEALAAG